MYDLEEIRRDFPILQREVYGRPLVYLDNGATTQKPRCVIDAMTDEYLNVNANVHRGVHYLSQQATEMHEQARETVRQFINARRTEEIVFTRGTTEGINLVAATFGQAMMKDGDEVIVTEMEHHSNIVPWQLLQAHKDIRLRVCPITDEGRLNLDALERLFTPRTRLVACTAVSNVLGTVNPIEEVISMAHAHDVPVLVDAAQAAPHRPIDVQTMDCDFLAFSGHKVYGPTGIGVLYGKEQWLDRLPPYMGGGEMIDRVSFEHTTFNSLPYKFEAGTPDYVATTGLARALDYVNALGFESIMAHEHDLTAYALQQLTTIPNIRIFGPLTAETTTPSYPLPNTPLEGREPLNIQRSTLNAQRSPLTAHLSPCDHEAVISFLVGSIHHLDLGTLLDRLGIAVRTGHHCAEPLMHRLGVEGTVRASFALYNTTDEVDAFVAALNRVVQMF